MSFEKDRFQWFSELRTKRDLPAKQNQCHAKSEFSLTLTTKRHCWCSLSDLIAGQDEPYQGAAKAFDRVFQFH